MTAARPLTSHLFLLPHLPHLPHISRLPLRLPLALLLAFALLLVSSAASALTPDHFARSSALASGHRYVRIAVDTCGIHRISYDTLAALGFTDPSQISVWGYGAAVLTENDFSDDMPDDLVATYCLHQPDERRLLFYGEADLYVSVDENDSVVARRNVYDKRGYYYLSDRPLPAAAEEDRSAILTESVAGTHLSVQYIERELDNPGRGGAVYLDKRLSDGAEPYQFTVEDFSPTDKFPSVRLDYSFAANSAEPFLLDAELPAQFGSVARNLVAAPSVSSPSKLYSFGRGEVCFDPGEFDGSFAVGFSPVADDYVAIDNVSLVYPRSNVLRTAEMTMCFPELKGAVAIESDFNDRLVVLDVSRADRVARCRVVGSSGSGVFAVQGTDGSSKRLHVFDPVYSDFPQARVTGEVMPSNLHAMETPEMVILTTEALKETAEELAELHRSVDAMDVTVVSQQDIFNEFSSGCRSAMAVRLFLKMLDLRSPGRLKHVLLYGSSDWDRSVAVACNSLICYEAEDKDDASDIHRNYVSDKYFAMLDDSFDSRRIPFGRMSVNVGRINVSSPEEGRKANDKIRRFMERRAECSVYGDVVVLSDVGDEGVYLDDAVSKIERMAGYNPNMNFIHVHCGTYPYRREGNEEGRRDLSDILTRGNGLFFYCGHSSANALTSEHFYDASCVGRMTYEDYPVAILSTCETLGFDRNSLQMGTLMHSVDHGGAIAVVGACRSVYMDLNRSMADAIVERYAMATPETTVGDIVREAHNRCILSYSDYDRAVNSLCFNLCGDPSLKLGAPSASVVVESIGGQRASGGEVAVGALGDVIVEGRIGGLSDFEGEARVRVYDGPVRLKTRDDAVVTQEGVLLCETKARVKAGRFRAKMTMAESGGEGEGYNRMCVTAVSDDKKIYAAGVYRKLKIVDAGYERSDSAPAVESLIIEDDASDSGVNFSVVVRSERGLVFDNGSALGPSVVVDGRRSAGFVVESVGEGLYAIKGAVGGLMAGRHEIRVRVNSLDGVSAEGRSEFVVSGERVACRLEVDGRVARRKAVIAMVHNFAEEPTSVLMIEDARGGAVRRVEGCAFPYEWDLTDGEGRRVADGRYFAYVLSRDSFDRASTPKVEIVVIRR